MTLIQLIKQVVDAAGGYAKTTKQLNLRSFALYLLQQNPKAEEKVYRTEQLASDLVNFIVRLNKYATTYTKLALVDSPLKNIDEVSFLLQLYFTGDTAKHLMIENLLLEYTTGNETLKRLERQGLVKETINPEDKRGKIISITLQGAKTLTAVLKDLEKLSNLVVGDLNTKEQESLHTLLNRLDHFHLEVRPQAKKSQSLQSFVKSLKPESN